MEVLSELNKIVDVININIKIEIKYFLFKFKKKIKGIIIENILKVVPPRISSSLKTTYSLRMIKFVSKNIFSCKIL